MDKNTSLPSQNQFDNKAQAWSARFSEPVSDLVKRYTASVNFDQRMAHCDIQGSLAHAEMLESIGIISPDDRLAIERGMARISKEIDNGDFRWSLDFEDVHLNIEKRMVELVGDAGTRPPQGPPRTDQAPPQITQRLR